LSVGAGAGSDAIEAQTGELNRLPAKLFGIRLEDIRTVSQQRKFDTLWLGRMISKQESNAALLRFVTGF
jgi:hypothetical protein